MACVSSIVCYECIQGASKAEQGSCGWTFPCRAARVPRAVGGQLGGNGANCSLGTP